MSKIRNEKGDSVTHVIDIKITTREYYLQLYINKIDNLEEMDKFPENTNY